MIRHSLLALLVSQFLLVEEVSALERGLFCQKVELASTEEPDSKTYLVDPQFSLAVGYDNGLDKQGDYGARVMLFKKTSDRLSLVYHSKGSADSYGRRPTFIKNCGGHELLIFAEMGTEYSWGLRVFSYNAGNITDLGDIPLAVEGEADAESVIPFMRFSQRNQSVFISFTKDLILNPGSPNEKQVLKSQLRYRITGNKLSESAER